MPCLADALFGRCPVWPMPDARCPVPYAQCTSEHVTEKGYNYQGLPIIVKAAQ